jgi:hypothetical protein
MSKGIRLATEREVSLGVLDMGKSHLVEEGIYSVPLILSLSLKPRRRQFEQTLLAAQRRIVRFAETHGWKDLTEQGFFDHARIFDAKADFDKALAKTAGLPPSTVFPKTYSAALEGRVLMAVSPELYVENYPEGVEEDSFEKLLAHEIAHRLHIRVLNGNEDAMGPTWFYEGFASYAADQFEECTYGLKANEIREVLAREDRGSYREYASVFRFFAEKAPIKELIEQASKKDFSIWLSSLISL